MLKEKVNPIEAKKISSYKKCAFHPDSYGYAENMHMYENIQNSLNHVNSDLMRMKIIFHIMAIPTSFDKIRIERRLSDIVTRLNDDFNNYSENKNTLNAGKYRSIINNVFLNNMEMQKNYLDEQFTNLMPTVPSEIIFEISKCYYYKINNKLDLSKYDDDNDVEIQREIIKKYIHNYDAGAIYPESYINVWIVDFTGSSLMGFSSFPWEHSNKFNGIVLSRRVIFPEDYAEKSFNQYKTLTHQIGHYFGLMHTPNKQVKYGAYFSKNVNLDKISRSSINSGKPNIIEHDPTSPRYEWNNEFPLFMNFMDYTSDNYVCMFTKNQIKIMKSMINKYYPKLIKEGEELPESKFNPQTDSFVPTQKNDLDEIINKKTKGLIFVRRKPIIN